MARLVNPIQSAPFLPVEALEQYSLLARMYWGREPEVQDEDDWSERGMSMPYALLALKEPCCQHRRKHDYDWLQQITKWA